MSNLKKIVTILFLLCAAGVSYAYSEAWGQINFSYISIKDGLSQSTVFSIAQDKLGNMWFATYDGVNKYDGYAFTVYQHDENDPNSIANDIARIVMTDSKGRVWIGTRDGLSYYDEEKDKFQNFFYEKNGKHLQVNGMPDRTLVQTPEGEVKKLTVDEFIELDKTTIFKKNTGHEKVARLDKQGNPMKDKKGNPIYKAGKKNGWLVEQGGYPPLAFGFSGGWFYIKANSDRRWLTDKTDRCNANPEKTPIMKPVTSEYKSSTIAYKMPFADFPKDCWVTFRIHIDWTTYGKEAETIVKPGKLDVQMEYTDKKKTVKEHIVNNEEIQIGRNDDDGYYFKFGIYRVGNSTVPVCYNLAGYKEE